MVTRLHAQPERCRPGATYLWEDQKLGAATVLREVEFVRYCPHPGEVVVRYEGRNRIIHRRFLYQRNGDLSENLDSSEGQ